MVTMEGGGGDRGPLLGCPVVTVILQTHLDLLAKSTNVPMFTVLALTVRCPGFDETPGIWQYPRLADPLLSWWLGDASLELRKQAVYSSRGLWRLQQESSLPPKVSQVIGSRGSV